MPAKRRPRAVLQSLHETQLPAVRDQARSSPSRRSGDRGRGIEVGSYVGAFLAAARECELRIEGVDINGEVNDFTRSLGFTVHDGDLASFDAKQHVRLRRDLEHVRPARRSARRRELGAIVAAPRRCAGDSRSERRPSTRVCDDAAPAGRCSRRTICCRFRIAGDSRRSRCRDCSSTSGSRSGDIRADVLVPIADEWTRPGPRARNA